MWPWERLGTSNLGQTDVDGQTAGGREDPGAGDEEALGEPTKSSRNSGGTVPTAAISEQCSGDVGGREEWPSLPPALTQDTRNTYHKLILGERAIFDDSDVD